MGILFTTLGHRELAQVFYSIATALAWFSISLFPPVPPLDALFLPITFFATICAADWWFQRGVVLPVLKQAHNLFNAFIALPTALATLATPRRKIGWKITSSVTSEGRQVCWRTLGPAAFLITLIIQWHAFHNDKWLVAGSRPALRSSAPVLDGLATDHAYANHPSQHRAATSARRGDDLG
jgi:hypothetical protein